MSRLLCATRSLVAVAAFVVSLTPISIHARTWTASDGRTLEADFVSSVGGTVTLKRAADGQTFTLPLFKLSAADQEWIKTAAAPGAKPGAAPAPAATTPAAPHKAIEGPYASLITGDWALSEHEGLPFALYAGKEISALGKYPLLLMLHGKSQNNDNGKQVGGWMKTFAKPDNYAARPCILLAPLCYQPFGGTGGGWSDKPGTQAIDLVKKLIKSLPIDEKRIYVMGHSMGGFGTTHLMGLEPRLFTAGIPVAGCTSDATRRPIWIFHAADDEVVDVSCSRNLAKALERSKVAKYTEYPTGGHGVAGKVFDTPEVHTWLFSQMEK